MNSINEVHLSVRSLVEFLYRSGDLDNRSRISPELAMHEGNRIHRMLQKKGGSGYRAEISLKWRYATGRYDICLEGRADGIMEDYVPEEIHNLQEELPLFSEEYGLVDMPEPLTYIDEIKSTYRKLGGIREPYVEHLAQAKCYAYIVAMEEELAQVGVRVTYYNIKDQDIRYFHYTYNKEELEEWFEGTMQECRKWLDYSYDWKQEKIPSIQKLPFPYAYREGQKELASYVYQTIYHGRKLFLEAPTGVGKTLSTVFPAVKAVGQGLGEKIFYLTAKTITRTVAEDTFGLLREKGMAFKDIVITAKEKICANEACECNPVACPYAKGHFDRVNDCLYALITQEKRFSREVIEQYAGEYQVCPYELSLDVSLFADGVICDYNYVFDPHVYLRRYFSGDNVGKYIFLIDEAHNLLDRGREMYSASLVKEEVLELKKLLKGSSSLSDKDQEVPGETTVNTSKRRYAGKNSYDDKELIIKLEKLNKVLLVLKKKSDGLTVFKDIEEVYQAADELREQFDHYINNYDGRVMDEIMDFYFKVSHFVDIYEALDEKYVIYGQLQDNGHYLLKLLNVDPSNNLKERMKQARSTTLFSATLLPIQYHKELLGGEREDYEVYAHSVFPTENRGLFIARDVTSKYTRRGLREYERIAEYLHAMIWSKQGNYMAFFPSYAFMEEVYQTYLCMYAGEDAEHILQSENMTEADREGFLEAFREPGERTLLGFCVLGGIFSEGIDLKNDCLIGAAIVGTGLPQVGQERELLKSYFDHQGNGFDYAYRFPGMNKVLQAAGRVIRTMVDVGVVLLLDERFLQGSYRGLYPREWEHVEVVDRNCVAEKIASFWGKRGDNASENAKM